LSPEELKEQKKQESPMKALLVSLSLSDHQRPEDLTEPATKTDKNMATDQECNVRW
jgi:hypothetical protein